MSAGPTAASSGIKNDKIISDSPVLRVALNVAIPIVVSWESNEFTVTKVAIGLLADTSTLTKPRSPRENDDGFPCWSVPST